MESGWVGQEEGCRKEVLLLFAADIHVKVFVVDGFVDTIGGDGLERGIDLGAQAFLALAHGYACTARLVTAGIDGGADLAEVLALGRLQKGGGSRQRGAKSDIAAPG